MAVATEQRRLAAGSWFSRPGVREGLVGWLFASPWIIGFIVFTFGPMLFALYASFTDYNITTPPDWVGTRNYESLMRDDRFYTGLGNTIWMVIVKVPIVVVAALVIAMLLTLTCLARGHSARSFTCPTCCRARQRSICGFGYCHLPA